LSGNLLEIPVRLSGGLRARKDDDGNERDDDRPEADRERLSIDWEHLVPPNKVLPLHKPYRGRAGDVDPQSLRTGM
jgi:hypothetical protein